MILVLFMPSQCRGDQVDAAVSMHALFGAVLRNGIEGVVYLIKATALTKSLVHSRFFPIRCDSGHLDYPAMFSPRSCHVELVSSTDLVEYFLNIFQLALKH